MENNLIDYFRIMAHEDDPDIDVPMDIKNPEGNVLGKFNAHVQMYAQ